MTIGNYFSTARSKHRSAIQAGSLRVLQALPVGHRIELDRGDSYYREVEGPAQAPTLLLLHGWMATGGLNWLRGFEALGREFRVIAPDLRGHGDSEWAVGSSYALSEYVYDLAQLIHQTGVAPVPIIGHSLGGMIALRYAGVYPDNVSRLVAIEGLGGTREMHAKAAAKPPNERLGKWIDLTRGLSGRLPRRYDSLEDAYRRMENENPHLTAEQARHLTVHGANQNEDGTFSWKFDNYVRIFPAYDLPEDQVHALWARIACPGLRPSSPDGSWSEMTRRSSSSTTLCQSVLPVRRQRLCRIHYQLCEACRC